MDNQANLYQNQSLTIAFESVLKKHLEEFNMKSPDKFNLISTDYSIINRFEKDFFDQDAYRIECDWSFCFIPTEILSRMTNMLFGGTGEFKHKDLEYIEYECMMYIYLLHFYDIRRNIFIEEKLGVINENNGIIPFNELTKEDHSIEFHSERLKIDCKILFKNREFNLTYIFAKEDIKEKDFPVLDDYFRMKLFRFAKNKLKKFYKSKNNSFHKINVENLHSLIHKWNNRRLCYLLYFLPGKVLVDFLNLMDESQRTILLEKIRITKNLKPIFLDEFIYYLERGLRYFIEVDYLYTKRKKVNFES